MNGITHRSSIAAQLAEQRLADKGHFLGAVSYDPVTDKIFDGDGSEFLDRGNWLIDLGKFNDAQILMASGKIDAANKVKSIYSNKYLQMLHNKKRILDVRAKSPGISINQIGKGIVGAAGATAVTDYDTIRRTGDLLSTVIGQKHTNEDYQAINIANKVDKNSLKFEYVKRTNAVLQAQSNLGDDEEALPIRNVYATSTKEIFAYGLQWVVSTRDTIDNKTDVTADFLSDLPGAFMAAKNADVVTLLNAITGNNQGDWDAFTSGIADVNAASQLDTAESSVKAYGGPLIGIFAKDSLRGYFQNLQGAYFEGQPQNLAGRSLSDPGAKSGTLPGNPAVNYFVDDTLTAGTYVIAAQKAYMQYFQGMVIQTSYKNPKNPGQTEQRFWYDFAGFEETQSSAAYKGTSVLA